MTEKEIEKMVYLYCKENNIAYRDGKVNAKYASQIQSFINNVLLKRAPQQPEMISSIVKRAMPKREQ